MSKLTDTLFPHTTLCRSVVAPLTTAFRAYAERDLRWQGEERRYELLNGDLSRRGSYGGGRDQGFASALDEMKEALALDRRLRFLVVQDRKSTRLNSSH